MRQQQQPHSQIHSQPHSQSLSQPHPHAHSQPHPQSQYVIQSNRDMTIGPPKVIEKLQPQVKSVETIAIGSYPNYSYAYPAAAAPKQYHMNEATTKVRKHPLATENFEKSNHHFLTAPLQSKVDTVLPNPAPHINQHQAIGVIVKHDTHKGTPVHVSSSQHLNILHQQQLQHQPHHLHQQSRQPPSPTPAHNSNAANVALNKPKVSSPAPAHFYGRPSGTAPIIQTEKVERVALKHRKTFEMSPQTQHYGIHPPPAHLTRSIYESPRIFTTPPTVTPQQQQALPLIIHNSLSSPTNVPRPLSRSPGIRLSTTNSITSEALSFQTQPLDLGVSDRMRINSSSPKRKNDPLQHPSTLEVKYKRINSPSMIITEQTTPLALNILSSSVDDKQSHAHPAAIHIQQNKEELLQFANSNPISQTRDELSPSLNVANSNDSFSSFSYNNANNNNNDANHCSTNNEHKTTVSSSTNQSIDQLRTSSDDGLVRVSSENSSPVPSPNSTQSSPATPAKLQSEPEKSSSPGEKISSAKD